MFAGHTIDVMVGTSWMREYYRTCLLYTSRPTITKPGLPIGTFWGYVVEGFDNDGNFIFQDNNGSVNGVLTGKPDGKIDENDKTDIGNPHQMCIRDSCRGGLQESKYCKRGAKLGQISRYLFGEQVHLVLLNLYMLLMAHFLICLLYTSRCV